MNDTIQSETALSEEGHSWLVFASIVLIIAGIMRIMDAIWAWQYNGLLSDNAQEALLGDDLDTYGWLWALVGAVLILAGLAVLQRSQLARWIGIFGGAVLAITAWPWIPIEPVWALVYVGIGVLVIYGLAAKGGPLRRP